MKLASGFCIPEPSPRAYGYKRVTVHPLIRFWLRSRVDEKSADLHKAFHLCLFLVGKTCDQRTPSQQRFPWGTSTREQILKEQITDDRVFSRCRFVRVLLVCGRFLSADEGHDRSLQCLGAIHVGLSGLSRGSPLTTLGDLRVTVRASPPGTSPRTSYSLTQRTSRLVPG